MAVYFSVKWRGKPLRSANQSRAFEAASVKLKCSFLLCQWTGRRWISSSARWLLPSPLRSEQTQYHQCVLYSWSVCVWESEWTHTLHLTVHRLGSLQNIKTNIYTEKTRSCDCYGHRLPWLVEKASRTWLQEVAAAGWCHQRAPQNLQRNCTPQKKKDTFWMLRFWNEVWGLTKILQLIFFFVLMLFDAKLNATGKRNGSWSQISREGNNDSSKRN